MRTACKIAGLPLPDFEFDNYNFSITINSAREDEGVSEGVDVPVRSIASNRDLIEKFGEILNGEGVNEGVKIRLEKELLYLNEHKHIKRLKMESVFSISTATAERDLTMLKRLGLIVFEGAPKTGKYILTEKGKKIFNVG